MLANQISVKVFSAGGSPDLERLIPIFHGWIRDKEHRLCGKLLFDVADYRHVKDGPGVVLIGHEAHWSVGGVGGGGLGLVFARKRDEAGELPGKLAEAFHDVLEVAAMLESEAGLGLRFDGGRARVAFMNRLHAGNDDGGLAAARPEVEAFAGTLWGAATTARASDDARAPLAIDVVGKPATVAELRARLR